MHLILAHKESGKKIWSSDLEHINEIMTLYMYMPIPISVERERERKRKMIQRKFCLCLYMLHVCTPVVCREREMIFQWPEVKIANTTFEYLLCKQEWFLFLICRLSVSLFQWKKWKKLKQKRNNLIRKCCRTVDKV